MTTAAHIEWFKKQFGARINAAVAGSPITLDLMAALACQETGEMWPVLRLKNMSETEILALCVGDTLDDTGGRDAFPRNKKELVEAARGKEMFDIARKALVDMAAHIKQYRKTAERPNKFCHGFGIFQYDLQFFKKDPDYFLERRWHSFDACLDKALGELRAFAAKLGFKGASPLGAMDLAKIAIAYNTGSYNPAKELKQGHQNSDGKFYGELIFDFIKLAQSVPMPGAAPGGPAAPADGAVRMRINARGGLRLRGGPGTDFGTLRTLPFEAIVHVIGRSGDWALVDEEGDGVADGHMHAAFLVPA